jgi:hypothetical protein
MNDLAAQLPALLGVVVGVVASFVMTSLRERTQWARAQRVR